MPVASTVKIQDSCTTLLLMLVLALPWPRASNAAKNIPIELLATARSALYERFITAYRQELQSRQDVTLTTHHLDDDQFSSSDIDRDTALLVTIGTRAASFAGNKLSHIPVLNTLIPESSFHTLAGRLPDCDRRSAIFIDQPVRRQARLAELLYPDAHTYGVLLGPTSRQRLQEIDAIRLRGDVQIETRVLAQEPGTAPETLPLLKQSDLLLAINDPLVLNRESAKWLLYEAYERRLPVIGFSRAYVRAGAAAAVFSEPEQLGRQAAEITRRWLDDNRHCLPPPRFSEYFRVAVNRSVNTSLGGRDLDEDELVRKIRFWEAAQ
jgi:putative ABC transport system substrate-binding protein